MFILTLELAPELHIESVPAFLLQFLLCMQRC